MATIRENYFNCLERINHAIDRSGREAGSVQLVVVTKGQPAEKIAQVIDAGATCLGENYPEETAQKIPALIKRNITWHMIGHIQSRKIKYLVDYFGYIHSIDSLETARKVNEKFAIDQKHIPVLYEINISGEESKHGFLASEETNWGELLNTFDELFGLNYLNCCGLMTMPPLATEAEESRQYFKKMVKLQKYLGHHLGEEHFQDLSMGTSVDYEIAIQEGATFVRVGEAIMGQRSYKKD